MRYRYRGTKQNNFQRNPRSCKIFTTDIKKILIIYTTSKSSQVTKTLVWSSYVANDGIDGLYGGGGASGAADAAARVGE